MAKQRIGFIGLGIMGMGMVENLINADYELKVFNRTKEKAECLAKHGVFVANSPAEAAASCEIVITMLSDPKAVLSTILDENGVIYGLEKGAVLVDCSTIDPSTTKTVCDAVSARGARFLDSPVAGSKDAAAKGELILMVGGEIDTLNEIRPVLDVISKKIIYAGPTGSGTSLKLCFNLCVSHMAAALCEALILGVKSGLNPEVIIDTFMSGTIAAPFYEWKGGCIMDRNFTTNFSTRLMHKDLNLMMSAAYEQNVPLPVTATVKEFFGMATNHGEAENDFCSAIKVLEDLVGIEVKRSI